MKPKLVTSLTILCTVAVAQVANAPTATLPNGRRITPAGDWIPTAPYPFAIAVRPDGNQIAVPSIGFPFALNIIDQPDTDAQTIRQLPEKTPNAPEVQVHTGVAYSPDSQVAYVATGDTGAVDIYSASTWQRLFRIPLDGAVAGKRYTDSFAASVLLDATGQRLYVLDQANWRVVMIDTFSRRPLWALATGVNPIAMALAPDGKRLYIANSGLFEYKILPGIDRDDILRTGLRFPPFGYPSRAAEKGVRVQGRKVPGLGDPNSVRGNSLWTYTLDDSRNKVPLLTTLRLGEQITAVKAGTVGGAAPSAVVASNDHVYVALSHEDEVAIITADGQRVESKLHLTPFPAFGYSDKQGRRLRGVMPSGLALSPTRLYVTEAGINAVATVDLKTNQVLGHRPVGWNPSAAALARDGQFLFVVNTKGKGTGPNGGPKFDPQPHGSYIGELEFGSISVLPVKGPDSTLEVVANNEAALQSRSTLPQLKHVFLIIRENRTFDEVFGDLPHANANASLARYGLNGWTEEMPVLTHLQVTPNAHALAQQFATSDNFYADSDVSADGHRWVLGIASTPWMNIAWTSNYGGRRHSDVFSSSPGRRAMFGGADAPMPEDEPQFGSLWEHVAGAGLPILNYGEGLEIEGSDERDGSAPEGQRNMLNAPLPRAVFESTDRAFPTFNLGIPDSYRFAEFKRDFTERLKHGRLPALIVIRLPNDHTAEIRRGDGYPYRASYVADNDLALGNIVAFLSQSNIWTDSAIFVTEDDAQGGRDHVDAHRSVLLVASPWVKPDLVSHRHVSMGSIGKTIYALLGLGSLNLEDALAADLSDMFTDKENTAIYVARPADNRIFNPDRARIAKPKTRAERAALLECDNPRTMWRDSRH